MIEELFGFVLILTFQFFTCRLTKFILLKRDIGPFGWIAWPLRYIGVWVHELSHFGASFAAGVKPTKLVVKYRNETTGRPNPHGKVEHEKHSKFLQSIFISLAPLIFSTVLIYWSLTVAFSEVFDPLARIVAGFFCLALFLGGSPSNHDLKNIGRSLLRNPAYSFFQVLLLASSIAITWFLVDIHHWVPPIDFSRYISIELFVSVLENYFTYLLVPVFYFAIKFSLMGIDWLFYHARTRNGYIAPKISYRKFTRRRFKPKKPRKLGIREAPW